MSTEASRRPAGSLAPDLRATQALLTECVLAREPIASDPRLLGGVRQVIRGKPSLSADEQADIYRRQFWLRHRSALVEDYPGLLYILGSEAFDKFIRAYLDQYVPSTPSLRDLGNDMVTFAQAYRDFPEERRLLAIEMVRYERAHVDVFDGPDPTPLDPDRVASLPAEAWQTAKLVVNPFVARLGLAYAVHELRFAILAEQEPALPSASDSRPHWVLLYREDNVLRQCEISKAAFDLLATLAAGVPLIPATEQLIRDADPKTPAEVEQLGRQVHDWFRLWARLGIVMGIELPEAELPEGT